MAMDPESPLDKLWQEYGRVFHDFDDLTLVRSEEHTSELQSPCNLVCRLLLEKKKKIMLLSTRCSKRCTQRKTISSTSSCRINSRGRLVVGGRWYSMLHATAARGWSFVMSMCC